MRSVPWVLLLCGFAWGRTVLEDVDIHSGTSTSPYAGIDPPVQTGDSRRRLRQTPADSVPTQLIGGFEVPLNPEEFCYSFPDGPSAIYRVLLQFGGYGAAREGECTLPLVANNKYIAQISVKCLVNPKTKLARSIRITYKTVDLAGVDEQQRQCFFSGLQGWINSPQYGYICYVAEAIKNGYPGITPARPDLIGWLPAPATAPGACTIFGV